MNFIFISAIVVAVFISSTDCATLRRKSKNIKVNRVEEITPGYKVKWTTDVANGVWKIDFDVEVNSTGFIGLGLSKNGTMAGADIVIGGVDDKTNATYFHDMHAEGHGRPIQDTEQNYKLLDLKQSNGTTSMSFTRNFTTGDVHDAIIKNETTHFIWAIGATDDIGYHGGKRGAFAVNLLSSGNSTKI